MYRLQIRTPDNEWKYVKHVEGGITCNAADTLSFLTKVSYRHLDWHVSLTCYHRGISKARYTALFDPPLIKLASNVLVSSILSGPGMTSQ